MSTERQDFSIPLQTVTNAAYALARGYAIVRTYADEGVSGVGIYRREGLKRLLADVLSGEADFTVILVYDVSRWGRFQNPDQSAHYDFICAEAGVRVEYCAEPFENDDTLITALLKNMKRVMAAEYSRDLSAKVRRSKALARAEGYWPGGPPPFGLRRQAVTRSGRALRLHEPGQWKGREAVSTHVRIALGPQDELAVVRRIFRMFLRGASCREMAERLNDEGLTAGGRPWGLSRVRRLLRNEVYAGTLTFGKVTSAFGRVQRQPRERWVQVPNACPATISRRTFQAAQREVARRARPYSDEHLLEALRSLLDREGRLSEKIVNQRGAYCVTAYRGHFGGMLQAYERIGYRPSPAALSGLNAIRARYEGRGNWAHISDDEIVRRLRCLLAAEGCLSRRIIDTAPDVPPVEVCRKRLGSLGEIYALVGYTPGADQAAKLKPLPPGHKIRRSLGVLR